MRNNAPLPALANSALRLITRVSSHGQRFQFGLDFVASLPGVPSAADLAVFVTAYDGASRVALLNCLATDVNLDGYTVSCISSNLVPSAELNTGAPTPGAVAGSSLPSEMTAVIRKRTALKGQHGMGRFSVGPVPVSFTAPAVDPNRLTAGSLVLYATYLTTIQVAFIPGVFGWFPGLTTRPIPPATVVTLGTQLTIFNQDELLGTARRRKEGRGQ